MLLLIVVPQLLFATTLPDKLPFSFRLEKEKDDQIQEAVDTFTKRMVRFFQESSFFQWVLRVSHGMDASTGLPDYLFFWDDIEAMKKGDVVTFSHTREGGGHNIMIPTSKFLAEACAGYLLTGDPTFGKIVEQFSKGITATMKGMLYDENDPEKYIMARNIITHNHSFTIEGGKKKKVDYTLWRTEDRNWNANRIHFPNNPYWGDIWVTNMRSKDDLPHIYRAAGWLRYVIAYGRDPKIVDAAREAYAYLQGFARDIVEHGYHIRTKDESGKPYIPDQDLASFVDYGPKAECNAKLATALIGYGEPKGNDCGEGDGGLYEDIATRVHYFNYKIIQGFHMSALFHALLNGYHAIARELLYGLAKRAEELKTSKKHRHGRKNPRWNADLAVFLLQAASLGLPLSSEDVQLVLKEYNKALDAYSAFKNWDLWDPLIPDGIYGPHGGYKPDENGIIRLSELGFMIEFCFSPFKNPKGQEPVNCSILRKGLMSLSPRKHKP